MFTPALSPSYFFPTYTQYPSVNNPTAGVDSSGFSGILPKSHLDLFAPDSRPIDLNIRIYPEWFKEVTLSWTVPPAWNSMSPRFNIYRSEVEGSGYMKLNAVPVQTPYFVDATTKESSKSSKEYYIVESILSDGTIWKTRASSVGDGIPRFQYIRLKEINRREWILLRRYTGNECLILRGIHYGARCPNCWDTLTEKMTKPRCVVCYGTGYDGGYYPGIRTYVQFDASSDSSVYTYFGKMEQNEIGAWTIQYPAVETFDLVIRIRDFKVFRVSQVSDTEILNKTCRQIMRLEEQSTDSVVYKLLNREGLLNV